MKVAVRVALADDSVLFRDGLAQLLRSASLRLISALDQSEALIVDWPALADRHTASDYGSLPSRD